MVKATTAPTEEADPRTMKDVMREQGILPTNQGAPPEEAQSEPAAEPQGGDHPEASAEAEELERERAAFIELAALEATRAKLLRAIPKEWANPPADKISKLPKPLDKNGSKGRCNECGGYHVLPAVHLDYFGHADTTLALIAVDPMWSWEPFKWAEDGSGPFFTQKSGRYVMWGWLTVLGKRVLGVGTCASGQPEPEKELIGDFLRNASMRLGIATALWSKAESHDVDDQQAPQQAPRQPRQQRQQGQQAKGGAQQRRPAAPTEPAEGSPSPPMGDLSEAVRALYDLTRSLPEDVQAKVWAKAEERHLAWDKPETWKGADTKLMAAFIASVAKPSTLRHDHAPSGEEP